MNRVYYVWIISVIFTLVGCTNPNTERPHLEDLGMVGVMGFDYVDEENTKVTVTLPQPQKDAEEKVQQYSTVVKLPHQSIMDVSTLSDKILTTSQLRVLLFSEEYSRKMGLWKVLENIYRDPQIGTNVYIAIVKGNVEEILSANYKDKPEINVYLNELLTPREVTAFSPFTTLHHFIYRKTDEVSDPLAPYLEFVNNDSLKISKVALFKKDKMIDTIEPDEAKLLEAMRKRRKLPDISIQIPGEKESQKDEELAILKFVGTRYHAKVNGDLNNPKIFLHLYVRGSIVDYDGQRTLDTSVKREELQEKISERLEEDMINLMKKAQELGIDPIAVGEHFRIKNAAGWSKEKWTAAFKNAEITAHVETRIISTGTLR
ncbi:Ger(x)C family spore germination protein [Halalkalibacter urbisdiaboli]|uniref:Ger(x)C family spore germination protein n=1 Tax=Halalkalibacter urbisdiaboli TaxID=1960589 RepID=UPI0013FE15AF|nr:Ger(x)C family spore germination protein [Halalkalibacter urbisdiaboli]